MKKKIILILSMLTLCVSLFAISVSASEYSVTYPQLTDEFNAISYEAIYSECDFRIAFFTYADGSDGVHGVTVTNPLALKSYLNQFEDFESFRTNFEDYNHEDISYNFYYDFNEGIFNYFYNYTEITSEDLTTQYNQGKTDGVTEYKESEEYTNALETEYQAGVSDFKESAEYKSSLNNAESNGYTLGMSAGKEAFKASDEFQNALDNQYTLGFNDGTVSAEENAQPNVFGILFGITGFGLLAFAIIFVISSAKKKSRSKR